ncbi:MAG: hypothetical protein IIY15_03850 [Flavobacteriales bacterium]|nr:hypothetical protein [Flavobacteriales bacterium]
MTLKIKHISFFILSIISQIALYGSPSASTITIPDSLLTIYDLELSIPAHARPAASDQKEEGEVIIIKDDREILQDIFSWQTYESISLMDTVEVNDCEITANSEYQQQKITIGRRSKSFFPVTAFKSPLSRLL